jgi:hypothetical protein
MRKCFGSSFAASVMTSAAAAAIFLWAVPARVSGQSKAYTPPRAWDGKADLQGIWQAQNTANVSVEARTPSLGLPASRGYIVDPADGKIPYLSAALAKRNENFAKHATADPVGMCYMPGVPRLMYMPFPFQIFQSAKYIIIASEYVHNVRTIYMDGSKHIEGLDFWNGDSRGHWEGDTLVVDVTTFNDQTWFDQSGNYHSDALHVVERFTRTAEDVLTYEATIEDPKVFSRPWRIRMPLSLHKEPNFRLLEYECHSYMEDAARGSQ